MLKAIFQRVQKNMDGGLWLVLLLSLGASLPLLLNPAGLPNGADTLYHSYRAALMTRSWEGGDLLPRWADALYYGYGAPLWQFYAPLSYLLTSALQVLGFGVLAALRTLILLSFAGLGVGMYLFMKRRVGKLAGMLAALAALYAPYVIYTLPYARGALPELLALAIFPWVLWRFTLLMETGRARDLLWATFSLLPLLIAHNLLALLLTVVLAAYVVWQTVAVLTISPRGTWRAALRPYGLAGVGLLLGVGLAAWFWLPILLEANTVHLENLTGTALLNYRRFFVWPDALFGLMPLPDVGAINGLRPVPIVGLPQWALALIGLIGVLVLIVQAVRAGRHDDPILRTGIFFALVGGVGVFLILPASDGIWQALPLLQYLQFPWRWLGPVALSLAVLVGMNALWITRLPERFQSALIAACIVPLIVLAAPAFTVPEWRYPELDTSVAAIQQSEAAGIQRGTTFTDEYRPRDVKTVPGPVPELLADYADSFPIDRGNVPEGVNSALINSGLIDNEWQIRADDAFRMEVYTFYWPGWTATIDGQTVPITPSAEHGLITFEVPAGRHTVRVSLGTTLPRVAGALISGLSLIALLAAVAFLRGGTRPAPVRDLSGRQRAGVLIGGLIALVTVLLFLPEQSVLWLDTPPGRAPAEQEVRYTFGDDEIRLLGYDVYSDGPYAPGDTLRLALYWIARDTLEIDYSSFVHVGEAGVPPVAQADREHPGGRAMTEWWSTEGYIYDDYEIRLPDDLPTGEYGVFVGLYTCELAPPDECGNGYRPPVVDQDDAPVGDVVPLLTIEVR